MTTKKLLPLLVLPLLLAGCATKEERKAERMKNLCAEYFFDTYSIGHRDKISKELRIIESVLDDGEYISFYGRDYDYNDLRKGIEAMCKFYRS